MGSLKGDDKLQAIIDKPHASKEMHQKAYETLTRRHAQGSLPPVIDGTEDPVEDYVEILGIQR